MSLESCWMFLLILQSGYELSFSSLSALNHYSNSLSKCSKCVSGGCYWIWRTPAEVHCSAMVSFSNSGTDRSRCYNCFISSACIHIHPLLNSVFLVLSGFLFWHFSRHFEIHDGTLLFRLLLLQCLEHSKENFHILLLPELLLSLSKSIQSMAFSN